MVKHTTLTPLHPHPHPHPHRPDEPHSGASAALLALPTVLEAPPSQTSLEKKEEDELQQEIQNEISLRILETKEEELHKPLPNWMRNYRVVCYCTYFLIACFSLYYLGQIWYYLASPWMEIQYADIVSYLELNSYSIMCPLLCPIFMMILAYHLNKNVNLEEADFFGLLGFLLFFALVNFHDGYGVWKLAHSVVDANPKTNVTLDPPPMDVSSMDDLHWQYAWSTSRRCAKKWVRDLIYQKQYDRLHVQREVVVEFGPARERQLVEHASGITQLESCDKFNAKTEDAKIRNWMNELQMTFTCCGPYGYNKWKMRFNTSGETHCNEGWGHDADTDQSLEEDIHGCYDPLMKWLIHVCNITFWIMITQGILFIVSIIMAVVHHTAMKLEAEVLVRQYSLLDMRDTRPKEDPWWRQTRPDDKPVITGAYDGKKWSAEAADGNLAEFVIGIGKLKHKHSGKKKKTKTLLGKKLVNINSTISVASFAPSIKSHHELKEKKKPDLSESTLNKLKHLQHLGK